MKIAPASRTSPKSRQHNEKQKSLLRPLSLLFLAVAPISPTADAVVRTWIGGNTTWNDNAGNSDWSGSDEPDSNDDALFNTANNVILGTNQSTVLSLTLTGGADLDTDAWDMDVDGTILVDTSSTSLTISDPASLVTAFNVATQNSGRVTLDNGVLTVNDPTGGLIGTFTNSGSFTGRGTLNLTDLTAAAPTVLFDNTGTLTASAVGLVIIGNPPAGTLTINISDADGRIDLDGGPGSGIVNVNQNQTLDINATLNDPFNGTINLSQNSTLDISTPWSLATGALLEANNGAIGFPFVTPAGISHIDGGAFTQSGGTILVTDTDGTLQFDAPFSMTGGILTNNGTVIFNADTTIGASATFDNPVATSSLTVNPGVTVTVNQLDFNADGTGASTNVITVNSGGTLALNIGAGADDSLSGAVVLNGGTITVDDAVDADWSANRTITTGANTGVSTLAGDPLQFSAALATTVNANSTLVVDTTSATFAGATFTGAGTLQIDNNATYSSNTTFNVASLNWDGGPTGNTHTINAGIVLTINSTITDTMDDNVTLNGNGGSLVVNGPATWTLDGTLTTNPADVGLATIGGTSHMVLTNTFTVTGDTSITAPVTFGATNTTTVAAAAILTVDGDSTYTGSTITGAGTFNPSSTNHVTGNTTISVANFNFDKGGSAAWTVDPAVTLTVNVTDYDNTDPNLFQGTVTLNSGNISVTTGDSEFVANGNIVLNNTTGTTPVWSGEGIDFGDDAGVLDSNLNVGGAGDSVISAQVDFNSDADVNVAAGATLVLTNTTIFVTVNAANNAEFTGAGTFVLESAAIVGEAATLNMVGGTVDLDGRGADDTGDILFIQAPLTINAATLNSFGKSNGVGGPNTLDVNNNGALTGALAVNLDAPASEWTLNSLGVINLINDATVATLLTGNPLNVNGALNITGDVRSTARIDIGSTGVITVNTAAQPFRLGGGTLADPNRILAGTVNGTGPLGADADRALFGRGTINTDIDFDGNAELRATGGTLTLNGTLLDVGIVGTADASGTLALTNPQTLLASMTMELLGGTVNGAALTNQALIRGNGTVANNTTNAATGIIRPAGGTLRFTGINGANAGRIELNSNTAEFNNALTNSATGLILGPGTLRANGNLTNNGTIRAVGPTAFFGAITNNAGSLLDVDPAASATFDNNVTVSVGANATMGAGSTSRFFAALTVSGTVVQDLNVAATSFVTLTINATGTFDSSNNRLIVDYAGASPINTIRQYILVGRLFSSVALADPDNTLTIGYAEASALGVGSWSGLGVDGTAVLTRLTYFGDATMDGLVNADDFTRIDRGIAMGLTGWINGDFNHSGTITPADYMLIDRVFLEQGAPLPAAQALLAQRASQFGPDYVSQLVASIPEPTLSSILYPLSSYFLSRRRRAT